MPLNEQEWVSIAEMIEREIGRISGRRVDPFVMTVVTKVDIDNMNVYCADEFGITPIPLFAFKETVIYYDSTFSGAVVRKEAKVILEPPQVGDVVLICREMSADRLPRCLGVLRSSNFIIDEDQPND